VNVIRWDPKQQDLLRELEALEKKLFSKTASWGGQLGREASRRNTHLLVARSATPDNQLVGYLVYSASGLVAHIAKLATVPSWRRRGVGRQLVRAVLGTIKLRRIASVTLHVDASNEAALGLYRGEGFTFDGCLEDYYGPGRPAHKLRLELAETWA
jgi:ribosomal-protein-alanine N-acetyltransferase